MINIIMAFVAVVILAWIIFKVLPQLIAYALVTAVGLVCVAIIVIILYHNLEALVAPVIQVLTDATH